MKKIVTAFIIFFLPSFILRPFLNLLGHAIGKNVKIGFSLIFTNKITIGQGGFIGHFNVIKIPEIQMGKKTEIKHLNVLKGPFLFKLDDLARIANKNQLKRAGAGVTYNDAIFHLGYRSNITSGHFIDLTNSIVMGSNTVLGGFGSQMWTHGYVHAETGDDRFRVDGKIVVGNNVYIGSSCIFNPGVEVANAISIGGGTVVSKNLTKKGMYVNQALRFIEQDFETVKTKLNKVENDSLTDEVYTK